MSAAEILAAVVKGGSVGVAGAIVALLLWKTWQERDKG